MRRYKTEKFVKLDKIHASQEPRHKMTVDGRRRSAPWREMKRLVDERFFFQAKEHDFKRILDHTVRPGSASVKRGLSSRYAENA